MTSAVQRLTAAATPMPAASTRRAFGFVLWIVFAVKRDMGMPSIRALGRRWLPAEPITACVG